MCDLCVPVTIYPRGSVCLCTCACVQIYAQPPNPPTRMALVCVRTYISRPAPQPTYPDGAGVVAQNVHLEEHAVVVGVLLFGGGGARSGGAQ